MSAKIIQRRNGGFTLLEVILYIALLAILLGSVVTASFEVIASSSQSKTEAMLFTEGDFLLSKIQRGLSMANTVNIPSLDGTSTILSFNMQNQLSYNPITFSQSNNSLVIRKSGGVSEVLNNSNIVLSNLIFFHSNTSKTKPEFVDISFTLSTRSEAGKVITEVFSLTHYFNQ